MGAATAISGGDDHTCAILSGGAVQCWGLAQFGALGSGNTTNNYPGPISDLNGVTAIAAGGNQTCALLSTHRVECWGTGGIGHGAPDYSYTPVEVTGITDAIAITAGESHSCALLSDHTIECWGGNTYGQLGDGTTATETVPSSPVGDIMNAIAISAGENHTCALLSDHTVECWGDNQYDQLGLGYAGPAYNALPMPVSGLSGVTQISAGGYHTCALIPNASTGTIKCWGHNAAGELGNGTTDSTLVPVTVSAIAP